MLDRTRWSAIGAAIAVALAGGVALPSAGATNTTGGGAGVVFVPIVPCRLFDTRVDQSIGPRTSPLGTGDTYTQQVTGTNGKCTIPAGASAVAMNVTTVNATAASFLTIWPADAPRPLASNLNWVANAPATPNKVDVQLSTDGKISLYNLNGTVDVLADIVGYYADHNHDDRYYTKPEVDAAIAAAAPPDDGVEQVVYGTSSIEQVTSNKLIGSSSGCAYEADMDGVIPLSIPVGSRLVSVDAAVLDLAGVNDFDVSVGKTTTGATANTPSSVALAAGGSLNITTLIHLVLTPLTTEIADANEAFYFTMHNDGSAAAFCNAVLTYDTSP